MTLSRRHPLWRRILFACCWYGFIWLITELPQAASHRTGTFWEWIGIPQLNGSFRIASHMFVFGVQSIFIYAIFRPLHSFSKKYITITLIIVSLLGVVDEIHQSYMPGRFPRGIDVVKDVLGAMLFLYLALVARFKFNIFHLQKRGESS